MPVVTGIPLRTPELVGKYSPANSPPAKLPENKNAPPEGFFPSGGAGARETSYRRWLTDIWILWSLLPPGAGPFILPGGRYRIGPKNATTPIVNVSCVVANPVLGPRSK